MGDVSAGRAHKPIKDEEGRDMRSTSNKTMIVRMNIRLQFLRPRPITAGFLTGSFERVIRGKHHYCPNTDEVRVKKF